MLERLMVAYPLLPFPRTEIRGAPPLPGPWGVALDLYLESHPRLPTPDTQRPPVWAARFLYGVWAPYAVAGISPTGTVASLFCREMAKEPRRANREGCAVMIRLLYGRTEVQNRAHAEPRMGPFFSAVDPPTRALWRSLNDYPMRALIAVAHNIYTHAGAMDAGWANALDLWHQIPWATPLHDPLQLVWEDPLARSLSHTAPRP